MLQMLATKVIDRSLSHLLLNSLLGSWCRGSHFRHEEMGSDGTFLPTSAVRQGQGSAQADPKLGDDLEEAELFQFY